MESEKLRLSLTSIMVSIILVSVILTGMLSFAGGLFTNYNVSISEETNSSLNNISASSERIISSSKTIYEKSMNTSNVELTATPTGVFWVASTMWGTLKYIVSSLGEIITLGGLISTNLGVSSELANKIIVSISLLVIMAFIAILIGRDEI